MINIESMFSKTNRSIFIKGKKQRLAQFFRKFLYMFAGIKSLMKIAS